VRPVSRLAIRDGRQAYIFLFYILNYPTYYSYLHINYNGLLVIVHTSQDHTGQRTAWAHTHAIRTLYLYQLPIPPTSSYNPGFMYTINECLLYTHIPWTRKVLVRIHTPFALYPYLHLNLDLSSTPSYTLHTQDQS